MDWTREEGELLLFCRRGLRKRAAELKMPVAISFSKDVKDLFAVSLADACERVDLGVSEASGVAEKMLAHARFRQREGLGAPFAHFQVSQNLVFSR